MGLLSSLIQINDLHFVYRVKIQKTLSGMQEKKNKIRLVTKDKMSDYLWFIDLRSNEFLAQSIKIAKDRNSNFYL